MLNYPMLSGQQKCPVQAISGIWRSVMLMSLVITFNIGTLPFALADMPGGGWLYYRPINLSMPTPDANFQVKVILTANQYSGIKSGGTDLRFYDEAGNNCEYWIETWNPAGNSILWVKVVTSGTDILVMYYGNATASAVSNGNTTFDFFDDFTTPLGTTWTTSGSVTQSKGMVTLATTDGTTAATLSNTSPFSPSSSSFVLETKHYEVGYFRNRFYATTSTGGGSPVTEGDYGYFANAASAQPLGRVFWNGSYGSTSALYNNTNYLTQWYIVDNSTYNWSTYHYSTGGAVSSGIKKTTCSSMIRYISISVTDVDNTSSIIDWIRLRKGSATESVGTAGSPFANTVPTTPATYFNSGVFIVPDGVTSITVECWGGGGGGSTITINGRYGGGGGGGAFASSNLTVTQGMIFPFIVGTGGGASANGSASSFNTSVVVADGGKGAPGNSTIAGEGGSTASSTGTTKYAGGNGAYGIPSYSGGGGGGAGTTGPGGDAPTAALGSYGTGTSFYGGNGGASVSGNIYGKKGSTYGGGGSGACKNGIDDRTGGAGANGLVVISWCIQPAAPTVTSPVNYCLHSVTHSLSATGTNLLWYTTPTEGTGSATAPSPSTSSESTTFYYVSQTIGCESPRAQIEVDVNPLPVASVTAQTNISCYGEEDGTITISGCGGTGSYSYSVDNGATWTAGANPNVVAGLKALTPYKIRVKDSNGCESAEVP